MDNIIQKKIDSGNGIILLPPGEYKGPFFIDKPCIIEGNGTTLWNKGETVLVINSDGVTLKNLRIELTEPTEDSFALCTSSPVVNENVEISGCTAGFGEEDTVPEMNRQLKLGKFSAETENTFIFEIYSPGNSILETDLRDVKFEPVNLIPGINRIRLSVTELPLGTFIFGEFILRSEFQRRFYINGSAEMNAEKCTDRLISTVDSARINELRASLEELQKKSTLIVRKEEKYVNEAVEAPHVNQPGPASTLVMARGERINIDRYKFEPLRIYMGYRALFKELDIDLYAFMLDENGVTSCDDDFVFFGNRETMSGALTFNEDKSVQVDLLKVPDHIKRISLVYSIYKPGPADNFSKVMDPFISIVQNNKEIIRYTASELYSETTIIFMEMYKHSSGWKLNTIGQGYKDGLKRLCANYGLIVS